MTKKKEIRNLATQLLSYSDRLEPVHARAQRSLIDGLDAFESLAELTTETLAAQAQATSPQPSAPPVSAPAAQQQQQPAPQRTPAQAPQNSAKSYGTQKREYQAALSNDQLIQALLDYHGRTRPRGSSAIIRKNAPQQPAEPLFSQQSIPQVEAEPKPRRSLPGALPILRSKKP